MDYLFQALLQGTLTRTCRPGLIRLVKLENYLPQCPSQTRLARAIAYAIAYAPALRQGDLWELAQRANHLGDWTEIALYVYRPATSLQDLLLVDFADRRDLLTRCPGFRDRLNAELRIIANGRHQSDPLYTASRTA